MVDRRSLLNSADTIYLKVWNTTQRNYLLEFNPINLSSTSLFAYLEDKYLHNFTPISLSEISQVYFSVNTNPASSNPERFMVVLSSKRIQPIVSNILQKTRITAYPNPISGKNINLQFENSARGIYHVDLVNSLGQVVFSKDIQHAGGSTTQHLQLDKKLANGIYQLQLIGKDVRTAIKIICN